MANSTSIDFFPSEYNQTEESFGGNEGVFISPPNGNISSMQFGSNAPETFEDEEPLWKELGFDPDFIKTKTLAVLFKKKTLNEILLNDTDLGGPLIFCLLLGGCLVLSRKIQFGYVFGYGLMGSLAMCLLLNLMSEQGIGFYHTTSVLGYCLAPMIPLALASLLFPPTTIPGFLLAAVIIGFCTYSASFTFGKVLGIMDEGLLFAYPILLLYTCFALIVMF